jgi:hypothetical protein
MNLLDLNRFEAIFRVLALVMHLAPPIVEA